MKALGALASLVLALTACDSNVVDAVREPAVKPVDVPTSPVRPSSLFHRYSFNGTGTAVDDSKGGAHGVVVGGELLGFGTLVLRSGDAGAYVDLPDGLISPLTDATFEAWVTWRGGLHWQRIFDFGDSTKGEDPVEDAGGAGYFFLAASSGVSSARNIPNSGLRLAYSQADVLDEEVCHAPAELPEGVATHVAVVVNQAEQTMKLYQNGELLLPACALTRPLSAIHDVNNWLGRSNFTGDARFDGIFDEFRIYDAALTDEQLAESFAKGPNEGL